MATFGERLRAKRMEKELTQEQLGSLVGLQKSGVAKYENGRIHNVSTEMVSKFAEALDIGIHELLGSLESNLFALGFNIQSGDKGVSITSDDNKVSVFFSEIEWERFKLTDDFSAVWSAIQDSKNKKTPDIAAEGLSEDRRYLIDRIMSLSEEEIRGLRAIVDLVLSQRDK